MADEIICLGDSITGWNNCYGEEKRKLNSESYPAFLEAMLRDNGKENPVINAGFDGAASNESLDLFGEYEAQYPQFRCVIVEFGTNDFYREGFRHQTSGKIVSYLSSIMKTAKQLGKVALVLNQHKLNCKKEELERIMKHNEWLERECRRQSAIYIGINSELTLNDLKDGVHPNHYGSRLIARECCKSLIENKIL